VLVLDDVITTGATLGAARAALLRAGAAEVVPAAFAATPVRRDQLERVA
jgi:predicted amidophosphoribosyltransferase